MKFDDDFEKEIKAQIEKDKAVIFIITGIVLIAVGIIELQLALELAKIFG